MSERAEFELVMGMRLMDSQGRNALSRANDPERTYTFLATQWAWEAWRAARALPQPEAPTAGWISVDVDLPQPEKDVLVRTQYGEGAGYDVAGLFHEKWMSHITQDDCKCRVTHWMPLPEAKC